MNFNGGKHFMTWIFANNEWLVEKGCDWTQPASARSGGRQVRRPDVGSGHRALRRPEVEHGDSRRGETRRPEKQPAEHQRQIQEEEEGPRKGQWMPLRTNTHKKKNWVTIVCQIYPQFPVVGYLLACFRQIQMNWCNLWFADVSF